jgi:peptidoglycan/LPS O-acetylase OafA/YrhL
MLAVGAVAGIIIYTLANTTVVHFQRFVLAIAKQASGELGGDDRRQVRALQGVMTPWWSLSAGWLCYVLLALSFVFAYRSWGWLGAGPLLVWAVAGTNLLDRVWPWPARELCARVAAAEAGGEGKLRQLEPDERELVTGLLLRKLDEAAGAVAGATVE